MSQETEAEKAFKNISKRAVQLAQKLAEVSYNMGSISTDVNKQNLELKDAKTLTQQMEDNSKIAKNYSNDLVKIVSDTKKTVDSSTAFAEKAADHINHLVEGSLATNEALKDVGEYLIKMPEIANTVHKIAANLRVLGFNAGILAVQSGGDSKGFNVVAEEMKSIANDVGTKTDEIKQIVRNMTGNIQTAINQSESAKANAEIVRVETKKMIESFELIDNDVAEVKQVSNDVRYLAEKNLESCNSVLTNIETLSSDLDISNQKILKLDRSIERSVSSFEEMVRVINDSEIKTEDTPFIELAKKIASTIEDVFENGIRDGEITLENLFDSSRQPVPGTNPPQYLTKFVEFTDRVLPHIQDPVLQENSKIAFCAAVVTPDGYLPTHNSIFSKRQHLNAETDEDINWNVANCRNRRIFSDRTGIAAANNTKDFLLMTYCRDMGGRRVIMNDVSAPIFVRKRHWGGLRIGYQI